MTQPDFISPAMVVLVSVALGSWWAIVELVREAVVERDRGSVGEEWWVDRARKGGGG